MTEGLSALDLALLDRWQRDFPLVPRPFATLAEALDLDEDLVIARTRDLKARGLVSRVGAVVRPNTAGASTLAALAVPPARLEAVARRVNAEPGVNHNYEREHEINLWFVATALDRAALNATLARIAADTGLEVLDLPLERAYHIDLGFPLADARGTARPPNPERPCIEASDLDRALLAALEEGLPLVHRPYAEVAEALGRCESEVIDDLRRLVEGGVVSRFGYVVRHRRLGFRANAMAVWDLPDESVDRVAAGFAARPFVTLCYRRPRRLPRWPYNLFCMIHGRERAEVERQLAELNAEAGTGALPQAVLFSRRCFKQRGARFSRQGQEAAA